MSIITSRLDNDFYNFTMGYVAWRYYPEVQVEYRFTNRTSDVRLANWLNFDRLREEIDAVRDLRFRQDELAYLRQSGLFDKKYLMFLENSQLPEIEFENSDGQLQLSYRGNWGDAIFWETPLLSLINQLYYEAVLTTDQLRLHDVRAEGEQRLRHTLTTLKAHPAVRLIEFGSRRRFSREWQARVTQQLAHSIPSQIAGTSNVQLAKHLGIPASGTMAHQLFMIVAALHVGAYTPAPLLVAQNEVLTIWEEVYGNKWGGRLLIALTDTFGTDLFLRHFSTERANRWYGMRQDSGEAIERCQQMLDFYRTHGIDPAAHTLVPSDGLNVQKIVELTKPFWPPSSAHSRLRDLPNE